MCIRRRLNKKIAAQSFSYHGEIKFYNEGWLVYKNQKIVIKTLIFLLGILNVSFAQRINDDAAFFAGTYDKEQVKEN
jgi:hypothetical protein